MREGIISLKMDHMTVIKIFPLERMRRLMDFNECKLFCLKRKLYMNSRKAIHVRDLIRKQIRVCMDWLA
jgi:hypothetical protein